MSNRAFNVLPIYTESEKSQDLKSQLQIHKASNLSQLTQNISPSRTNSSEIDQLNLPKQKDSKISENLLTNPDIETYLSPSSALFQVKIFIFTNHNFKGVYFFWDCSTKTSS